MGRLDVRVVGARNLADTQWISKPDPYCIVKLEKQHHKTSVKDNNLNPEWNEVFKFTVADESSSQVTFELWNKNVVSDELMGVYSMSLSGMVKGVVKDTWCLLQRCKSNAELRIRVLAVDFGMDPTPQQLAQATNGQPTVATVVAKPQYATQCSAPPPPQQQQYQQQQYQQQQYQQQQQPQQFKQQAPPQMVVTNSMPSYGPPQPNYAGYPPPPMQAPMQVQPQVHAYYGYPPPAGPSQYPPQQQAGYPPQLYPSQSSSGYSAGGGGGGPSLGYPMPQQPQAPLQLQPSMASGYGYPPPPPPQQMQPPQPYNSSANLGYPPPPPGPYGY